MIGGQQAGRVCGKWRRITSFPTIVFGIVIIQRISDGVDAQLNSEQVGLGKARVTGEYSRWSNGVQAKVRVS